MHDANWSVLGHSRSIRTEERLHRVQRAVDDIKAYRQQAEGASKLLMTLSERTIDPDAVAGIEDAVKNADARRGLVSLWMELKRDDKNLLARTNHETYRKVFPRNYKCL